MKKLLLILSFVSPAAYAMEEISAEKLSELATKQANDLALLSTDLATLKDADKKELTPDCLTSIENRIQQINKERRMIQNAVRKNNKFAGLVFPHATQDELFLGTIHTNWKIVKEKAQS